MKTNHLSILLFIVFTSLMDIGLFSQGSYYNGVDFDLEGIALKNQLASLVQSSHATNISYSQVWNVLKSSDLNPENAANVLLIYGYNDTDSDIINDRSRNKDFNGGLVGDWNREHVFPKSLGVPNLGTSGPGADAHHLRSSDVQMNGLRDNLKYNSGSGNAGTSGSGWYPGDEWKGDCARMIMYMYLRYGSRCLPNNVGIGSINDIDNNMVDLFLDWNALDPVSEYEMTRNDVVQNAQGNRNPFIDNPVIATIIWGGLEAEDPWGLLGPDYIGLNINAYLQGPYDINTGLMSDQLRAASLLPIDEPYSTLGYSVNSESTSSSILNVTGDDAVVDWVMIELRNPENPSETLDSRVALVLRNGTIISVDGNESLIFDLIPEVTEIIVAVRHRNHFGIRTELPVEINELINIDFGDINLPVNGSNQRIIIDNKAMMISGDANGDQVINAIDKNIYWRIQNGQAYNYFTFTSDFNLDGTVNTIDKNAIWQLNNSFEGSLE